MLSRFSESLFQNAHKGKRILVTSSQFFNTTFKAHVESNTAALSEAEKIVGYPTSFLNLRWLLNDEIANIALHMRKLIGTNHPLLNTARELLLNKQTPAWGLIVLLVSKAGGLGREFSSVDCDVTAGILHSQRVLAEITEMVRTSNLIHKSIHNMSDKDKDVDDLNFGNKLSLLTGDYLLSNSFRELAGLKCHEVNELISTCLRDLVEAEFIEPRDRQNRPLPAKPSEKLCEEVQVPNQFDTDIFMSSEVIGNAEAEWTLRHLLDGASLLAKCCQGTLILADCPPSVQKLGYLFGRNLALAWQTRTDLALYSSENKGAFSLINAPLMFHIQHDNSFYDELIRDVENENVRYEEIRKVVVCGPGIRKTEELKDELCAKALDALDNFEYSDAKLALINIVETMRRDVAV